MYRCRCRILKLIIWFLLHTHWLISVFAAARFVRVNHLAFGFVDRYMNMLFPKTILLIILLWLFVLCFCVFILICWFWFSCCWRFLFGFHVWFIVQGVNYMWNMDDKCFVENVRNSFFFIRNAKHAWSWHIVKNGACKKDLFSTYFQTLSLAFIGKKSSFIRMKNLRLTFQ